MARTAQTPLARIVEEQGRKKNWLAERAGCDPAHISRLLRGLHPAKPTAQRIADALDVEVSELWPGLFDGEQAA